jgi:hypothetical protein
MAAVAGKCGGVPLASSASASSARGGPEEMEASILRAEDVFSFSSCILFYFQAVSFVARRITTG